MNADDARQRHDLQRLVVETESTNADRARQLGDRISALCADALPKVIDAVLSEHVSADEVLRIDRLELNVGEVREDHLEEDLLAAVRSALGRTLRRLDAQRIHGDLPLPDGAWAPGSMREADGSARVDGISRTDPRGRRSESLRQLLLHGALPWWHSPGEPQGLEALLERVAELSPAEARAVLEATGVQPRVRRRLALQLTQPALHGVVRLVEPNHAPFVIAYAEDLDRQQATDRFLPASTSDFKVAKWEWILAYLLADRGSRFNTKVFVRDTLAGIAQRFNVAFVSLLAEVRRAISVAGFPRSAQTLQSVVTELWEEAEPEVVAGAPAGTVEARAEAELVTWLRGRGRRDGAKESFEVLRRSPARLRALVRANWQRAGAAERLAERPEPFLEELVRAVEPGHAEEIVGYSRTLQRAHAERPMVAGDSAAFRKLKWRFLLATLAARQGSAFQMRMFVRATIERLAAHHALSYAALVSWLWRTLSTAPISAPESRALPVLLHVKALFRETAAGQREEEARGEAARAVEAEATPASAAEPQPGPVVADTEARAPERTAGTVATTSPQVAPVSAPQASAETPPSELVATPSATRSLDGATGPREPAAPAPAPPAPATTVGSAAPREPAATAPTTPVPVAVTAQREPAAPALTSPASARPDEATVLREPADTPVPQAGTTAPREPIVPASSPETVDVRAEPTRLPAATTAPSPSEGGVTEPTPATERSPPLEAEGISPAATPRPETPPLTEDDGSATARPDRPPAAPSEPLAPAVTARPEQPAPTESPAPALTTQPERLPQAETPAPAVIAPPEQRPAAERPTPAVIARPDEPLPTDSPAPAITPRPEQPPAVSPASAVIALPERPPAESSAPAVTARPEQPPAESPAPPVTTPPEQTPAVSPASAVTARPAQLPAESPTPPVTARPEKPLTDDATPAPAVTVQPERPPADNATATAPLTTRPEPPPPAVSEEPAPAVTAQSDRPSAPEGAPPVPTVTAQPERPPADSTAPAQVITRPEQPPPADSAAPAPIITRPEQPPPAVSAAPAPVVARPELPPPADSAAPAPVITRPEQPPPADSTAPAPAVTARPGQPTDSTAPVPAVTARPGQPTDSTAPASAVTARPEQPVDSTAPAPAVTARPGQPAVSTEPAPPVTSQPERTQAVSAVPASAVTARPGQPADSTAPAPAVTARPGQPAVSEAPASAVTTRPGPPAVSTPLAPAVTAQPERPLADTEAPASVTAPDKPSAVSATPAPTITALPQRPLADTDTSAPIVTTRPERPTLTDSEALARGATARPEQPPPTDSAAPALSPPLEPTAPVRTRSPATPLDLLRSVLATPGPEETPADPISTSSGALEAALEHALLERPVRLAAALRGPSGVPTERLEREVSARTLGRLLRALVPAAQRTAALALVRHLEAQPWSTAEALRSLSAEGRRRLIHAAAIAALLSRPTRTLTLDELLRGVVEQLSLRTRLSIAEVLSIARARKGHRRPAGIRDALRRLTDDVAAQPAAAQPPPPPASEEIRALERLLMAPPRDMPTVDAAGRITWLDRISRAAPQAERRRLAELLRHLGARKRALQSFDDEGMLRLLTWRYPERAAAARATLDGLRPLLTSPRLSEAARAQLRAELWRYLWSTDVTRVQQRTAQLELFLRSLARTAPRLLVALRSLPTLQSRPTTAPRPSSPAPPFARESESKDPVYTTRTAGVVLLWPLLGRFFDRMGLLTAGKFKDTESQERAAGLVHHLATGHTEFTEPELVMSKVLCGLAPEWPVPTTLELDTTQRGLADSLLKHVLQSWKPLQKTSIAGLRGTFLCREGRLSHGEERWTLDVEHKVYDLMLDAWQWPLSHVKLAWMPKPLAVHWRK